VTPIDYAKLAVLVPIFLMAAPALGFAIKDKPALQRAVFAVLCFTTINGLFAPGNWGLTVASIETYRGHTKGYHFYFNNALAIALILACWRSRPREFRWLPPGVGLYLAYCGLSFLSIINAPNTSYVYMAAQKMSFTALLAVATFNYLRTEEDLQFFLRVMAVTMIWELLICLKFKYLEGVYQARGTFEHQNPLAMYSVLIGSVLLAAGLGPKFKGANLVLGAFGVCALIVQSTLSRAALAIFGAGAIAIVGVSLLEKPTGRRLGMTTGMAVVGAIGLLLSLDTIVARFHDKGNAASSELRHVMNAASKEMLDDHPLGIGWNNFALTFNPPFRYVEVLWDWVRSRNMKPREDAKSPVVESHYWLLLAETGYQGFGAYLLMITVGLWRNLRAFREFGHSFLRCVSLGIAVGCGLNYLQSTLERVLVQPRNLMLWLILLGVTGRIEVMRRERRKQRKAQLTGTAPL
jgi:hypothetical protein